MTVTTPADESHLGAPSDAELISSVRAGDVDAYGELFARHHAAAQRLARQLLPGPDADDLVSEAFAKVLNVLMNGGGPDLAFRAYLLTAVRRLHVDRVRAAAKATPIDDLTPYDPGVPFADTVIAGFEGGAAAKAFASLPERWQMVLWHLEVEGQKPAEVAVMLGMSANSVSALAYRAREGLRQAFLQMHAADLVGDDCRWTHDRLGAYVRNGLSRRDTGKVEGHLECCRRCTAMYLELLEVNSSMGMIIGPLVLGAAAAAYLGAGTTAAAAGTAAATGALSTLAGRVRDFVAANTTAVAGVGAAATVATVAATVVLVNGATGSSGATTADGPHAAVSAPSAPGQQRIGGPGSDPGSASGAPTSKSDPSATPEGTTSAPDGGTTGRATSPSGGTTAPAGANGPGKPGTAVTTRPPGSSPTQPSSPKPTKPTSPSPTTPSPTGSGTPTTSPTPKVADAAVELFKHRILDPEAGLLGNLVVTPSGVPGAGATVTVRISDGTLEQIGSGCSVSGTRATCQVGPGAGPLEFKVYGVPLLATATIALPAGWTDSAPGNNSDQLILTIL